MSKIWEIICFTIKENIKKKSFAITTIIIALVLILAFPVVAKFTMSKEKKSNISTLYIVTDEGLENLEYKEKITNTSKFNKIKFNVLQGNSKKYKSLVDENKKTNNLIAHITYTDKFSIEVTIPKSSKVKESDASKIASIIEEMLEEEKYIRAASSEEELKEFNKEYTVAVNTLGKGKESEMFTVVKTYFPLILALIMYFMLLTYGQGMTTSMTTEKNSKIIELLVSHTTPKILIIGKVIGNVIVGIGQIVLWIISIIIGIVCGNLVSNYIARKDMIDVSGFIEMIRKSNESSAFSASAIILFVILLILGFLFYSVFAAICGSFINKPEEASSILVVYTYTTVAGFFIPYVGTFMQNETCINISKYVPICIPFTVPMDILIGNIDIAQALIAIGIMLVSVIIVIAILGNVYERLVFNKLTIKELMGKKRKG